MGPLNAGKIFQDFSWNSCLAAERGSAAPAHPHLKRFKTFYRMLKGLSHEMDLAYDDMYG
jgi:hypothetical protein